MPAMVVRFLVFPNERYGATRTVTICILDMKKYL
jgi:hypothetical protein